MHLVKLKKPVNTGFLEVYSQVGYFLGKEEVPGVDSRQQLHKTRTARELAGFSDFYE